jgi:hypothetical protein
VSVILVIMPLEKTNIFVKELGHNFGDNTYSTLMHKIMLMKCVIY